MVYLNKVIKEARKTLFTSGGIELVAYLSIRNKELLNSSSFDLSPQYEVALKGFMNKDVPTEKVKEIVDKKAIKGVDATSNLYLLSGLYLCSKDSTSEQLRKKYAEANLRQKYFLSLVEPSFASELQDEVQQLTSAVANLIKSIGSKETNTQLDESIHSFVQDEIGLQELLILEDLEQFLLSTNYLNLSSEELIRQILNEFGNSVMKIIANRRKDHPNFSIKDEYDVQDILFVILKSVFPNLRDEDPIPKVGSKSTKIDLILRDEGILIEVKMMKQSDSNENKFIDELKVDFESYHACQWLKKLFCFVYDPYKKTKDKSNFIDLDGGRKKGNHEYDVEVVLIN